MRNKRAGALIIMNKKLLLVSNDEVDIYWTPGGRLDEGEDYQQALHRELDEELGVKIKDLKHFCDTTHSGTITAKYFLVDTINEPQTSTDEVTKIGWFTKDEIQLGKVKTTPYLRDFIFPELVKEELL